MRSFLRSHRLFDGKETGRSLCYEITSVSARGWAEERVAGAPPSLSLSLSNNAKRNTWARSARREDKRITGALCQRDPLPLHPSAEPRARRPTIFNAILRAPVLVTPLGLQDAQSLRTDNQFSLLYINFRDARLAQSDGSAGPNTTSR